MVAAIDAHNHLGRWLHPAGQWMIRDVGELIAEMDSCDVQTVVNLDGRWGQELDSNLDRYDARYAERFTTFCHADWSDLRHWDADRRLVAGLERSAGQGARGLKVWKDLGLEIRDANGSLVLPDDARLDLLWDRAGELKLPVMIHTADPVAFFRRADRFNERLEELVARPDRSYYRRDVPAFERLIEALESTVARHTSTTFIGAHVGCYAENLAWVDRMLATYSNFYVDLSARISELGRRPRAARALLLAHPDRVLFGTDHYPPSRSAYQRYFRFLETADENFSYSDEPVPVHGRWNIAALDLPLEVLRAIYHDNAVSILHARG